MRDLTRRAAAIAALAVAATLTGCAAIPTSGNVNAGVARPAEEPVDLDVLVRQPQGGETQQQILEGFIEAAASPRGNYDIAREYLTPAFASEWAADAGTTIDVLADRTFNQFGERGIRVQVVPSGSLAPNGQYLESATTAPVQLQYEFEQVDGEWRISAAPPGLLVDETTFQIVYRDYTLAFFDPQYRFLVPDVRWFAGRESAQTSIVRALLAGPAEWLAPAVVSAIPEDVTLDPATVPVTDGVAEVSLVGAAFDNLLTVQRMQYQLEQSLAGVRNVRNVELALNGAPVEAPDLAQEPQRTLRIDPRPVVYDGEAFGFLSGGDELSPVPGISEQVVALEPTGAALGPGDDAAAVRAADGVWLVRPDEEPVLLDPRDGLVVPALDIDDVVWSVPGDAPDALAWFAVDGSAAGEQIPVPWSGSRIAAIELSRDGTRLAALLADGARSRVVVASVQRDEAGLPVALGPVVLELAGAVGEPLDLAWLDSGSIGVLTASASGARVGLQEVGAPDTAGEGPEGAVQLDGANSQRDLRVLTSDGDLATRAGATWQVQDRGIRFLATQQSG
ncbi:LpqB family beta-propeller domain-containing protein [Agromyces sp. C10]|uniref:LpqB family beta-propeller domain-containing protein n=1 Tax=Agromyces sp. C10 TaxID=2935077 RepID=UPI00200B5404|nr:LpqB family beta-propeller domain-containing protein [Agromyces sp. C10]MCK8608701.1 LpqB family beta-propeller domain-containing protein [Agromyces sp. C10]